MRELEAWRAGWESRDAARYLSYYARDFQSDGMDRAAWSSHKQRVNAGKTWIRVALTNLSAFQSPAKQPLIVVSFDQDYRSNSLSQQTKKRQYWTLESGHWKIAYEAQVREAAVDLPESFRPAARAPRMIAVSQGQGKWRK